MAYQRNRRRVAAAACTIAIVFAPALAHSQQAASPANPKLERLEQNLEQLQRMLESLKNEIEAARAESAMAPSEQPAAAAVAAEPPDETRQILVAPQVPLPPERESPRREAGINLGIWGTYVPGKGFVLISNKNGEISLSLISYLRYLNQLGLDPTYTDSFGRTKTLDLRQDIILNKINMTFKGWLFDPAFTFRAWIWTQNPAMGQGAQLVLAGQLGYSFNDYFNIYGGVAPLPSTRSTNWTYPMWLKMDNRTVADEFFRASYSFGIWAEGKIVDGVGYRAMLANNLSALGVDAGQLDPDLATLSGALWWMPTTGEYGPSLGFGDYEYHERLATMLGVHYTRSREDSQSQPSEDGFENSQIRLSDGTLIFQKGAFGTDGQIRKATYQMLDLNAGLKYRGWSLEGEYYARWVGDFQVAGIIPVTSLFDQGFQLQASAMILRDRLQGYVAGSKIFGQYGNPWDLTIGANWYPFARREMHVNLQGIYLNRSPVGGLSYPYVVGGNGWLFNTDIIVTF